MTPLQHIFIDIAGSQMFLQFLHKAMSSHEATALAIYDDKTV